MEQTKATLNAIREYLAKNMPPHGKAMLFGSQARGTARADSDWDILVILDKDSLVPRSEVFTTKTKYFQCRLKQTPRGIESTYYIFSEYS